MPAVCLLLFFFSGLAFLPYPGLQSDEMLFAAPLYRLDSALCHVRILHRDVPVMTMSYVGALKTWIYAPILKLIAPSVFSLRIPALILGAVTIWIMFRWLETAHSRRAAWIGALLLATDTVFLLTTCFDWGPVALQHFLTVFGLLLVVHFHHTHHAARLFLAGLCFGLAFWDKALFGWVFAGLLCAALAAFPRDLWRSLSIKNCALAGLGLIAGASPFILYNVLNNFPTFHATSGFGTQEFRTKTEVLTSTWNGSALFGYLVNEDTAPTPRGPAEMLEACSFRLRQMAGEHRRNALAWAAWLALLLLAPALWWPRSRRLVMFSVIVCGVAWLLMALTRSAGGSAHHTILLWPFPHVLLAVIFAEASLQLVGIGKWLLVTGMALLIGANLLVTNQYFYQFARNGAAGSWTDAIYPLAQGLAQGNSDRIAVLDWGIISPLDVIDRGRLPLRWASGPFETESPTEAPDPVLLDDSRTLWLERAAGYEQFTGIDARFDAYITRAGFTKIPVRTYYDRNGRAIFETFHLRRR